MSELIDGALRRCAFPNAGEPVASAVSGGADSLALLVLAVAAGNTATAFHVDHGLRPGSGAEADVVAAAAAALGCRFEALVVRCLPGPNLEARARAARFAALPADVATGHTADDQAETVLLNLMRGSGPTGAGAMRKGARHPILHLRRAETHAIVAEAGLEVVNDPSNSDPAIRRNRVRSELLPLMGDVADRDVVPLLARFAELAAEEGDLVDRLAEEVDATSVAALRAVPLPIRRRALRRLCAGATGSSYPPDRATIDRALLVVAGEVTACELGDGYLLRRSAGRLVVVGPSARPGVVR